MRGSPVTAAQAAVALAIGFAKGERLADCTVEGERILPAAACSTACYRQMRMALLGGSGHTATALTVLPRLVS